MAIYIHQFTFVNMSVYIMSNVDKKEFAFVFFLNIMNKQGALTNISIIFTSHPFKKS